MSKHTPGPWRAWIVGREASNNIEIGTEDRQIAALWHGVGPRVQADAGRIVDCVNALEGFADPSAARELLEAAKDALTLAAITEGFPAWVQEKLRAAIAKATGSDQAL